MDMDFDANSYPICLSSFIDDGSIESHRYYLSHRTVLEMLKDRSYLVPNSEIELSLQDFQNNYGQWPDIDRLRISALHKNDPSNKILVLFCGPNMVNINVIRAIAAQIMNKDTLSWLILIVENKITSQAMKAVDRFSFKVEIFQITDLLVNITKHVLKPKHQLLTNEEKQRLLEKYNLEEKHVGVYMEKKIECVLLNSFMDTLQVQNSDLTAYCGPQCVHEL